MFDQLRRKHLRTPLIYAVLLSLLLMARSLGRTPNPNAIVWGSLWFLVILSTCAWLQALQRLRSLKNTPNLAIAGAQGLVELAGVAEPAAQTQLLSHWKKRPCLWCRYEVEVFVARSPLEMLAPDRGSDLGWNVVDRGVTGASFLLRDASGVCLIEPACAEILTCHRERWIDGGRRYTEWTLHQGDTLRVLGLFPRQDGGSEPFDVCAVLAVSWLEWKKDLPHALSRFDLYMDAQCSPQERRLLRREALRVTIRDKVRRQEQPTLRAIGSAVPGGFFLVSNLSRKALMVRYGCWFCLHLVVFVGVLWLIYALWCQAG